MIRKQNVFAVIAVAAGLALAPEAVLAAPAASDAAARCEALADLRLVDTTISDATFVAETRLLQCNARHSAETPFERLSS